MNDLSITGNTLTISSREIAELVGSRHDSVKRTIDTLAERSVIAFPQTVEKPTAGRTAMEYLFTGESGKRDSIVVVAQLCPEFTARLVDRWQELERVAAAPMPIAPPQSFAAALRLAADQAELLERQQAALDEAAPKVEALDRIASSRGAMCITDAAKHLQVQPRRLFDWLQQHRWIFQRPGSSRWIGYQPRIQSGFILHKITPLGPDEQGELRAATQVRITPKGLAKLALLVGESL